MIVSDLAELKLYPVANRGVPNSEHVPIHVLQPTDMGRYGLMVGITGPQRFAMPVQDNLFWFGDGIVNTGDWIFLYTGSGSPRTHDLPNSPGGKIYTVHWGRRKTMFANSIVVPILFRTDTVDVGVPPGDLPQIGAEGA